MSVSNRILQDLAVTAELCGTEMSQAAAQVMCAELSAYPETSVLAALSRLRREHQGRLTLAAIISRLDDGRPGAEEAWAMFPKDEASSAVVTTEMQIAMHSAWPLIQDGDRVAGRMAFKEAYERIVSQNRTNRVPVQWQPTLGHDKNGREIALVDATRRGLIAPQRAMSMLPVEIHERFCESVGKPELLLSHEKGVSPEGLKRISEIVDEVSQSARVEKPELARAALSELKKVVGL